MSDRETIIANADAEMMANLGHPVVIETDLQSIMGVVGLIQLACRHPGVNQRIRKGAEHFVDGIGAQLQEAELHGLATLLRAGWVETFDEVKSDERRS